MPLLDDFKNCIVEYKPRGALQQKIDPISEPVLRNLILKHVHCIIFQKPNLQYIT